MWSTSVVAVFRFLQEKRGYKASHQNREGEDFVAVGGGINRLYSNTYSKI